MKAINASETALSDATTKQLIGTRLRTEANALRPLAAMLLVVGSRGRALGSPARGFGSGGGAR